MNWHNLMQNNNLHHINSYYVKKKFKSNEEHIIVLKINNILILNTFTEILQVEVPKSGAALFEENTVFLGTGRNFHTWI